LLFFFFAGFSAQKIRMFRLLRSASAGQLLLLRFFPSRACRGES
jgi:hypothetical protein